MLVRPHHQGAPRPPAVLPVEATACFANVPHSVWLREFCCLYNMTAGLHQQHTHLPAEVSAADPTHSPLKGKGSCVELCSGLHRCLMLRANRSRRWQT